MTTRTIAIYLEPALLALGIAVLTLAGLAWAERRGPR